MAGKRYPEARPRIVARLELDRSSMRRDELFADEESEAESTRPRATAEWFEEDISELARHASPRVVHLELERVITPSVYSNEHRRARWTVRDGVARKVRDDLRKTIDIPRTMGVANDFETEAILVIGQLLYSLVNDAAKISRYRRQR
jgi:hypothetical protein